MVSTPASDLDWLRVMAFTETVGHIFLVNIVLGEESRCFSGSGLTATENLSKTDLLGEVLMEEEADIRPRLSLGPIETDLRDVDAGVLALHGPNSREDWALVEDWSP